MIQKVLILVISYNTEQTIAGVLDRIPRALFEDPRFQTEVLLIDNASEDRTIEVGRQYKAQHVSFPLTIFRNLENLGYGGNQKVGYQYAITRGYDLVAMVHGDGQYAPEELPRLLEPLLDGKADAVYGSRMMLPGRARAGGMPRYKWLGNKLLTWLENWILGTAMSEFHSGYRLYSCRALTAVPFDKCSSGFDFDTDIIIQFHRAQLKILELPIPTHYGAEVCHVNGLAYAAKILAACLQSRLGNLGIFYDPKFAGGIQTQFETKFGYPSSHTLAQAAAENVDNLLVIGNLEQALLEPLLSRAKAAKYIKLALRPTELSVTGASPSSAECFEKVILLDVLAKLPEPETAVAAFRCSQQTVQARLIATVPNVAFLPLRLMLLLGFFNYNPRGILDLAHRRLFTCGSIRRLFEQNGYRVTKLVGLPGPYPLALGEGWLSELLLAINGLLIVVAKSLFAYQLYVEAEPLPDLNQLVEQARAGAELPES